MPPIGKVGCLHKNGDDSGADDAEAFAETGCGAFMLLPVLIATKKCSAIVLEHLCTYHGNVVDS